MVEKTRSNHEKISKKRQSGIGGIRELGTATDYFAVSFGLAGLPTLPLVHLN